MRTVQVHVFRYSELSNNAKQRVRADYAANVGFLYSEEALNSLFKLAEHFGGRIVDYTIDYSWPYGSGAEFEPVGEPIDEAEIERRLKELGDYNSETLKGVGDCKLTGVCWDEDAIDGFRKAFHDGERDLQKLMEAAFSTWLQACYEEYTAFYEDEDDCFAEHADANDLEYLQSGKRYVPESRPAQFGPRFVPESEMSSATKRVLDSIGENTDDEG